MQVSELVGDEVQAAEDDLGAWLHLLNVVEVEDDTHLKHNKSTPLLGTPTVRGFDLAMDDQHIMHRES